MTPAAPSGRTAGRVLALGLPGIPEVAAGDDLATLLVQALELAEEPLLPGDVLVVSSKIVSKAGGLTVRADDRAQAVDHQTVRVVAERTGPRGTTRIVHSRCGAVMAAAGVDTSNVAPGTVLLLPQDPDALARRLRADLHGLTGQRPGVVISDTLGRPWRQGQVDQAIGAAGMQVLDDLRGTTDPRGNRLEVTLRAVADEIASLADLVKGKIDGVPAALVRGLAPFVTGTDGPGAAELLRADSGDWFRWGHVEAVRAALGVPPGTGGVRARPMDPGDAAQRLRRALEVARAGDRALAAGIEVRPAPPSAADDAGSGTADVGAGTAVVVSCPSPDGPGAPASPEGPVDLGALVGLGRFCERVRVAGRSEDLEIDLEVLSGPPPRVFLRARPGREL